MTKALQSFNHGGAEGDHKQGEQGHQKFQPRFRHAKNGTRYVLQRPMRR